MELKSYLLPLLKWWWLLLLASALAAATSSWTVRQEPEQYQSRATLMIGHAIQDLNPSGNQLYLGTQLAEAYADIAKREPIRQATMAALGMEWLPNYNVRALPNRQLLEITVVDVDPARAQAVANELANQLIRLSPGSSQEGEQDREAFVTEQLDKLQLNITETENEILAKQEVLGELFSAREIADTESEINALQAKLRTLQSTYAGLLAGTKEEALNTLSIIEPASFPARPTGPGKAMTILTTTAIAFALAAGVAYLLEYLDDTIKAPEQVYKHLGLPVVGTIARIQPENWPNGLVMQNAPRSPEAEGFRGLRSAVQFALISESAKTLLVTSPHQGDGKSLVAANLALAMAQAGQRTLLIDADLHRPSQHRLFATSNAQGLSTLLLQPEALEKKSAHTLHEFLVDKGIISNTTQEQLSVMTSGPRSAANPSDLLVSRSIRSLLNLLANQYDVIVLDTPPVMAVSDAVVLSNQVDSVFVLASMKRTRKVDLRKVLEHFNSVGASVNGVILNKVSPRSEHYYYAYSQYSDYTHQASGSKNGNGPRTERSNGFRERLQEWLPPR